MDYIPGYRFDTGAGNYKFFSNLNIEDYNIDGGDILHLLNYASELGMTSEELSSDFEKYPSSYKSYLYDNKRWLHFQETSNWSKLVNMGVRKSLVEKYLKEEVGYGT